jgi:hypothetical protein
VTSGFFLRVAKGRIVAMRLPSRRTFWLSAATLMAAIVVAGWFLVPRSRVTRENYNRIKEGMSESEVTEILGQPEPLSVSGRGLIRFWRNGPSEVIVDFDESDKLYRKQGHLATAWETLEWYAKKGAEKIGITWQ